MEEICRLCCSTKFVNNHIFDEENALYLKMSLYLPIKVFKNDRLPQKVCDRCSCKVNDFYQFCNETIEVQNRLRAVLISTAVQIEDSVDLTLIKHDTLSPPPHIPDHQKEHKVEPFSVVPTDLNKHNEMCHSRPPEVAKVTADQSTQTEVELIQNVPADSKESSYKDVKIKEEQRQDEEVKMEEEDFQNYPEVVSDNSEDDISLLQVQKQKRSKKTKVSNGGIDKRKRTKKNDTDMSGWDMLMRALPEGTAVTMMGDQVKQEPQDSKEALAGAKIKSEHVEYHCCICFVICYSRSEMLEHYKDHGAAMEHLPPPVVPPPEADISKCPRCQKRVDRSNWAEHWARHWDRDRRPYRCALCERVFRDHHQILKHGLSHKWGEESTEPEPEKRFVCDLCPEGFVHMRYLLAHRARAHPEAAAHALTLRCFVCGRSFAHLNSLRRHLRAHTGERNFLCNVCGKALSSREHLKFHIRIHTGYKPNVCKTCGKGFVKKCNLTLHERVHSGERPHVCPVCGKAFSQRSTLVIHERYHSGARPYVCGLCQRGFVAKGLLSMHLKTTCI